MAGLTWLDSGKSAFEFQGRREFSVLIVQFRQFRRSVQFDQLGPLQKGEKTTHSLHQMSPHLTKILSK